MLNIRHWTWDVGGLYGGYNSGRFGRGVFRSAEETLERSKELRELEHLIIVPGHGGACYYASASGLNAKKTDAYGC